MLHAHFLPELTSPDELAGSVVVVIDILRASTTITHALAAGASKVIPCLEVSDALEVARAHVEGTFVLGGERGGLPIEGFHFGNSPLDYTPRRVAGKTVIFTTTNGTKAMLRCAQASRVFVGAFVNLTAVVHALEAANSQACHLLCAGTGGRITREDVLFAGAIVAWLVERGQPEHALNDQARIARDSWQAAMGGDALNLDSAGPLAQALRSCQGGRNLRALGLEGDIDTAAQIDRFKILPELDLRAGRIRVS